MGAHVKGKLGDATGRHGWVDHLMGRGLLWLAEQRPGEEGDVDRAHPPRAMVRNASGEARCQRLRMPRPTPHASITKVVLEPANLIHAKLKNMTWTEITGVTITIITRVINLSTYF